MVEEVRREVTLDRAVALDRVNEVVQRTDVHEAGPKASHATSQEVVPSRQTEAAQDRDRIHQEIKNFSIELLTMDSGLHLTLVSSLPAKYIADKVQSTIYINTLIKE